MSDTKRINISSNAVVNVHTSLQIKDTYLSKHRYNNLEISAQKSLDKDADESVPGAISINTSSSSLFSECLANSLALSDSTSKRVIFAEYWSKSDRTELYDSSNSKLSNQSDNLRSTSVCETVQSNSISASENSQKMCSDLQEIQFKEATSRRRNIFGSSNSKYQQRNSQSLSPSSPFSEAISRRKDNFGSSSYKHQQSPSQPILPLSANSGIVDRKAKSTSSLLREGRTGNEKGLKRSVSFDPKVFIYEYENSLDQWASED